MPVPNFPKLSRKPALKGKRSTLDPTLRDTFENGMESTRARFLRPRYQMDYALDLLTPADVVALDHFVERVAVYGANVFAIPDGTVKGMMHQVRFSTLPTYADAGNVENEFRKNCTFQVRTV